MISTQYNFIVQSVNAISNTVYRVILSPIGSPLISFPGQYIKILSIGNQLKAYSIVNCDKKNGSIELHIRIRDHNRELLRFFLEKYKIRSPILISGPYGNDILSTHKQNDALYFAKGVGIAAFISTLEFAIESRHDKKIFLGWVSTDINDTYVVNFINICKERLFDFKYFIGDQNDILEQLHRTDIDFKNVKAYVSGPKSFLQSLMTPLYNLGISSNHIYSDADSFSKEKQIHNEFVS